MFRQIHLLAILLMLLPGMAHAQEAITEAPVTPAPVAVEPPVLVGGLTPAELNAPFRGSFFLTPLEVAIIQQALKGRVSNAATVSMATSGVRTVPRRVIRMSGVLYNTPQDWIVWMNGQKVTPGSLLPEIVDIKVRNSSEVDLEWYDAGLNRVIAITMRPQQTYDITTGILLLGGQ